jgi:hypothetical protein
MKPIIVKKIITDATMNKKEGRFFNEKDFKTIIVDDCDVYTIDEQKNKKLLLKFRKSVIKPALCCKAYEALEKEAQKKHNNRGSAGGLLNTKKLPNYVKKITGKSRFRSYYKGTDGKIKKDHISNYVSSGIIGYFDRYDRNVFRKSNGKKTSKKSIPGIPCRTTKFTKEQVAKWKHSLPLIKRTDSLFKTLVPRRHKIQLSRMNKTSTFQIENTAFSTITINFNYRTALHKDRGDLEEGFGNLIVLEKNKCVSASDDYKGGLMGFPQYGIAVNVRNGDFLAMDVHEWHCNTKIKPTHKGKLNYGRLSMVCYLRKNMIKCSKVSKASNN